MEEFLALILLPGIFLSSIPKAAGFLEGQRWNRTFPYDLDQAFAHSEDNKFSSCFGIIDLCIREEEDIPACGENVEGQIHVFVNFCEMAYKNCVSDEGHIWTYVRDDICDTITGKGDYGSDAYVDVPFIINAWPKNSSESEDEPT